MDRLERGLLAQGVLKVAFSRFLEWGGPVHNGSLHAVSWFELRYPYARNRGSIFSLPELGRTVQPVNLDESQTGFYRASLKPERHANI